jgi:hypothetical protein
VIVWVVGRVDVHVALHPRQIECNCPFR